MEKNGDLHINILEGGEELHSRVFPLRKKLLAFHVSLPHGFQQDFQQKLNTIDDSWKDIDGLESRFFVAERGGKDCGYVLGVIQPDCGFVHSLYIEPETRRSGIGLELMRRLLEWFVEQKVSQVELDVCEGNNDVYSFYKQLGFLPRKTRFIKKMSSSSEG